MTLDQFKCHRCKIIPEKDIYECDKNQHIICLKCASRINFICKCSSPLKNRKSSPLLRIVENVDHPCHHHSAGCKLKFPAGRMQSHLNECPYRPMHCIGASMNIWPCSWKGQKHEMHDHFKHTHPDISPPFVEFQVGLVPFHRDTTLGTIKMINAFDKQFIFLYRSNGQTGLVYFIIFLMGRKLDAEQFIYKFTILAPREPFRKIKFVESVFSDAENIHNKLNEGKCVVLTSQKVVDMLDGENLHFRFLILRKDSEKKKPQSTTTKTNGFAGSGKSPKGTPLTGAGVKNSTGTQAKQVAQTAPVNSSSYSSSNSECSSINCPHVESNPFVFPSSSVAAVPNSKIAFTDSSINKPFTLYEESAENDFSHNKREVSCMTLNVPCTRVNKR